MAKIWDATHTIEKLVLKMELIDSLAVMLWDSMANGDGGTDPELYSNGVLMLSDQISAFKKELREAFQTLHQNVKEANV